MFVFICEASATERCLWALICFHQTEANYRHLNSHNAFWPSRYGARFTVGIFISCTSRRYQRGHKRLWWPTKTEKAEDLIVHLSNTFVAVICQQFQTSRPETRTEGTLCEHYGTIGHPIRTRNIFKSNSSIKHFLAIEI